jgi:hypothetical protein
MVSGRIVRLLQDTGETGSDKFLCVVSRFASATASRYAGALRIHADFR